MFISYKQILKQSWQIVIRNKFLWIFGIFASFVSLENVYEIILSQFAQAQDPVSFYQGIFNIFSRQSLYANKTLQALDLFKFDFTGLTAFIIFGAILIFLIWLALTSQIFVIKSSNLAYKNKQNIANKTFAESSDCFLPVLSVHILTKLVLYAGFIALSLPLLYLILINSITWLIYLNVVFFILYIIFSVVIGFLAAYALNFIILKNLSVIEAVSAAWKLFKNNILISIEIASILFFFKLLSLILIFSLFLLFVLPLGVFLVFSFVYNDLLALVMILTILILVFTLISLFINSIFTTFYLAAWTITFTKLTEDTFFGKILNWIHNLPGLINNLAQKNKIKIDQQKLKAETLKTAREVSARAKILNQALAEKYQAYKPTLKKQSQKLQKQAKTAYIKYKPLVAKDINDAYKKFEPLLEKRAEKILLQAKKEITKSKKTAKKKTKTQKS